MAPKNKFTREEMVAAAVRVVQKMGAAALTAKSLAEELGTSTQPVFTCFGTMDTAKAEVYDAAEQVFDEYLTEGLKQEIPFFWHWNAIYPFCQRRARAVPSAVFDAVGR